MKKNNSYITDDEINLGDLARTLFREKILILSISVICGLIGYYSSLKPEEFKTEFKIKNPPSYLFEPYSQIFNNNNSSNNNDNNKFNNHDITGQFISDFELRLLSLDNLEIFVEESQDLDTFKKFLKSRNISVKQYFVYKLGKVKEKNTFIPNTYFFVFEKKVLDANIFIINYLEFTKKKSIIEIKKNLKYTIQNRINNTVDAVEIAKLINLENPIIKLPDRQYQVVSEPEALFYKGTKVLEQSIVIDKKLLQKLENDQFNYNHTLQNGIITKIDSDYLYFYSVVGFFAGLFLSFIIIFFKNALKE
jgi:LPS O-antigen subunit length determinant protein (WzzB/FepE family)